MDGDEKGQGAAHDNVGPANADGRVEERHRATNDIISRVVIDIERMIGRQMAGADHAARVTANDNGDNHPGRDEPEAE